MSRPTASDIIVLLVDLQDSSLQAIATRDTDDIRDAVKALIALAGLHAIPVVVTAGHRPEGELDVIAEITCAHIAKPIERTTVDAFETEAVRSAIAATGRKTVLLAGVATDIGILYTALSAKEAGYRVELLAEAIATTDKTAEDVAFARLHDAAISRLGFASLALGLMGDFAGPSAAGTLKLVNSVSPKSSSALSSS